MEGGERVGMVRTEDRGQRRERGRVAEREQRADSRTEWGFEPQALHVRVLLYMGSASSPPILLRLHYAMSGTVIAFAMRSVEMLLPGSRDDLVPLSSGVSQLAPRGGRRGGREGGREGRGRGGARERDR
eukprot:1821135-Rhodomonas_salina.1